MHNWVKKRTRYINQKRLEAKLEKVEEGRERKGGKVRERGYVRGRKRHVCVSVPKECV